MTNDTIDAEGWVAAQVLGPPGEINLLTVRFRVIWLEPSKPGSPVLLREPDRHTVWEPEFAALTNADGRTDLVQVQFGSLTGRAGIVRSVDALSLIDTTEVEVLAGQAVSVRMVPEDTLVTAGDSYAFSVFPADRHGNPASGPQPVLSPTLGLADVDPGAGTVTGVSTGIERVSWTAGPLAGSADVSVVPPAQVAFSQSRGWMGSTINRQTGLIVMDLAGGQPVDVFTSHDRRLSDHDGAQHAWSLDGQWLAYTDSLRLHVGDVSGSRQFVADAPRAGELSWTEDGNWVYFTDWSDTWRAAADGSGVEFVSAGRGRVSPSGEFLALYRDPDLVLHEFATQQEVVLSSNVRSYGWAPSSDKVYVTGHGGLHVIDLTGQVLHTVPAPPEPHGFSNDGFSDASFTPDGLALVAEAHGYLYFVDPERRRSSLIRFDVMRAARDPAVGAPR